MNHYHPTLIYIRALSFLLTHLVFATHGDQRFSEFSTGSASQCDTLKTLNVDQVFFISDDISADGRIRKAFEARSPGQKYSRSSFPLPKAKGRKNFQSLPDPFKTLRSLSLSSPMATPHDLPKYNPRNGLASFRNKNLRRYRSRTPESLIQQEYDQFQTEDVKTNSPEEFSSFMAQKFIRPYSSEMRLFPEQPSRVNSKPTHRPPKKDILNGLSGKVVRKKKGSNASHADHRDTPSKLPVYVQHILDQRNRDASSLSQSAVVLPSEYANLGVPARRPIGNKGNIGEVTPFMNILSSLGPDKVQELKQLLNTVGRNDQHGITNNKAKDVDRRDKVHRINRRLNSRTWAAGRAEENKDKSYQPPTYNLDAYVRKMSTPDYNENESFNRRQVDVSPENNSNGYKTNTGGRPPGSEYDLSMWRKGSAGGSGYNRGLDRAWNNKQHPIYPPFDSAEYNSNRELPEAVVNDQNGALRRMKRALIAPRNSIEHFPKEKMAKRLSTGNVDGNSGDEKFCRWEFNKGKDCRKLVIRFQYWIDGIRDCNKEYILITESGRENGGNKLCAGQERLTPFIVEGEQVSIVHFRDTNIGPGLTKFRGIIQCEQ